MMTKKLTELRTPSGFTMIEVIVVIAIIFILAAVGIPTFSRWLPNYRLKSAATDIFSNMQLAKMEAIKTNSSVSVIFDPTPPGSYELQDSGGNKIKEVNFTDYDDSGNIQWGGPKKIDGTPLGGDPITYPGDNVTFNSRGTATPWGWVYIQNQQGRAYAIGSLASGVVRLRKYNISSDAWE